MRGRVSERGSNGESPRERERESDRESKKYSPRERQRDYVSKRLPERKRDID